MRFFVPGYIVFDEFTCLGIAGCIVFRVFRKQGLVRIEGCIELLKIGVRLRPGNLRPVERFTGAYDLHVAVIKKKGDVGRLLVDEDDLKIRLAHVAALKEEFIAHQGGAGFGLTGTSIDQVYDGSVGITCDLATDREPGLSGGWFRCHRCFWFGNGL